MPSFSTGTLKLMIQAQAAAGRAEVGQDLSQKNPIEPLDALDLDQHRAFHEQVKPIRPYGVASVVDRALHLSKKLQPRGGQLD